MKIFLYNDETVSRFWNDRFLYHIKSIFSYKLTSNPLEEEVETGDFFIGRFNEKKLWLKECYKEINDKFDERIWPEKNLIDFYDDKQAQTNLFKEKKYPIPNTIVAYKKEDVNLPFPLVYKKFNGSSSKNVKLVFNDDLEYPRILQEYVPTNKDLRLICINGEVLGFERLAKEGDFRASGSGIIRKLKVLPMECVELVKRINKENDFSCMCYDFVKSDKWYLLEMSYTFNPDVVNKYCGVMPQDLVWKGILQKCLKYQI